MLCLFKYVKRFRKTNPRIQDYFRQSFRDYAFYAGSLAYGSKKKKHYHC